MFRMYWVLFRFIKTIYNILSVYKALNIYASYFHNLNENVYWQLHSKIFSIGFLGITRK